jgi:hypothetical protein
MVRGIPSLPFRRRGASEAREPSADEPIPERAPRDVLDDLALDDAPIGPPMLLPSAIYRHVIYDPVPAWAQPRPAAPPPAPEPPPIATFEVTEFAGPTQPTKPKPAARPRKPRARGAAAHAPGGATPRRTGKPRTDRKAST